MSNKTIEVMVEEIMRLRSDDDFEVYNNEELREHYRQLLREENN